MSDGLSQPKNILTVSAVNRYIKSVLSYDGNLSGIYISGEISNYKRYSSGHAYFSLKDKDSLLKCVMFSSQVSGLSFVPRDGMSVVAFGSINVYERDGVYQLYVNSMKQDGLGSLYEQFEVLKAKLEKEGLFDQRHKRPMPFLPKAVGVVTSPSGAVIQDIRNVTSRRFPDMPVVLYPVAVQGQGSSEQIARAVFQANAERKCDVLIVGRGGGSIEDLWSFNEEIVARAVYASVIPVISAVGHETDFTICDFTADLRAPTPSAAAELAVPLLSDLYDSLEFYRKKLTELPLKFIELKRERLERLAQNRNFTGYYQMLENNSLALSIKEEKITKAFSGLLRMKEMELNSRRSLLASLNPEKVLERGYGIVFDGEGSVVTDCAALNEGDRISVKLKNGIIDADVLDVRKEIHND